MANEMQYLVVEIAVKEGHYDEFIAAVKEFGSIVRKEPGCLRYEFQQDIQIKNKFWLLEQWASPKDLQVHSANDDFKRWVPILASHSDLQLHQTTPVV